jgi:hypothetical protein
MKPEGKSKTPADGVMTGPGTSAITPKRLIDIAVEVDRLCGAVRKTMPLLAFGDEPSGFRALLERNAR